VSVWRRIALDWPAMNAADRTRVLLAFGFPLGALLHVGWLIYHGDPMYRGPAPEWAPWFWYALCAVDFVVCWLMLTRPRAGVAAAAATMMLTLTVNWTLFPTFEFGFNYVLIGLTLFGAAVAMTAAWLWRASRWRLAG
jgi:hypothetical protein